VRAAVCAGADVSVVVKLLGLHLVDLFGNSSEICVLISSDIFNTGRVSTKIAVT
jgi:hypothetical protein